jgi:membrane protease YdiL (CAAX protease family)
MIGVLSDSGTPYYACPTWRMIVSQPNATLPIPTELPHVRPPLDLANTLAWGLIAFLVMSGGFYHEAARLLSWPSLPVPTPLSLFTWDILTIAAFGMIVFAVRNAGWSIRDYFGLTWPEKKSRRRSQWVGQSAFMVVVLWGAASMWIDGVLPASGSISRVEALAGDHWILSLLSLWIVGIVVAPVLDEIIFRGFLYRGLSESWFGPVGAIVVTSVLFGLAKSVGGAGWDWMILQSVLGLLFGWWRWRSGTVMGPILAHASMNFGVALLVTLAGAFFYLSGAD